MYMEPLEIKKVQYRVLESLSPLILNDIEYKEKAFARVDELIKQIESKELKTMYQCEGNGFDVDCFEITILSIIDKDRGLVYGYEAGNFHGYSKQYNLQYLLTYEEVQQKQL